jgi:3-hydroxymyristoyl/3-hydroxydecanoyl-(acyl carrier protein) dehydratase
MLDRITAFTRADSASGVKNVTLSEDVLHDHFPDHPVFPGAFIIESMAQLGGFLLEMSLNTPDCIRRALLVQIDRAKFYAPAKPGDQLILTARMAEQMEDAARIRASAEISGEKTARATLTFCLKEIDSDKINEQRRYVYALWTRDLDHIPEIL